MENKMVFLDIETTGLDPLHDDIIEIGAVIAVNGSITDRFASLVKPRGKVPHKIARLTGITDDMLADAPALAEVADSLLDFIGTNPIAGHNISFDVRFLNAKLGQCINNPLFDTMDLVQVLLPCVPSYRLETVRSVLGVNNGSSHRALADAEAACAVYSRCLDLLKGLNHQVLLKMYELSAGLESPFARILSGMAGQLAAQFPAGLAASPFAFMSAENGEEGSLFSTVSDRTRVRVDLDSLDRLLGPSGAFAAGMPQYKFRPGQVEMLQTVIRGFAEEKTMIIEAGTGTGKSLAYLVPAVAWAVTHRTKVVIATHTINLQEQLWRKDLPSVRDNMGVDFNSALVKGRSNYLCLRKWEAVIQSPGELNAGELVFCLKVLVWLTETRTGDRAELNIVSGQYQFWNQICSDQDTCLGPSCHWFQKHCFVSRARKVADQADILIVNHSLLLADLKLQNRLLPPYDYLIIDEAHHLENSATEQLGRTVSTAALKSVLTSLVRGFKSGTGPGVLSRLRHALRIHPDIMAPEDLAKLESAVNETFDLVNAVHSAAAELGEFLSDWAAREGAEADEGIPPVVRVKEGHRADRSWDAFISVSENYVIRSVSLLRVLKKITGYFELPDREKLRSFMPIIKDIEYHIKLLEDANACLHDFAGNREGYVYWVEADAGSKGDARLKSAPVSVSEILYESLFVTKKSTLLTSATISVDGSFEHFTERVGLSLMDEQKLLRLISPSPFTYETQALLCVTRDIPDPATVQDWEYIECIVPVIREMACLLNGRTMVLFTSHKMLREAYRRLQPELEAAGITLLGHGIDGGRTRLTEEFRRTDRSVLLGASSFWEGVDLPGEMLKCVIIARLPFAPPTTPVVEARIEELIRNGKDAFYHYTVPEAVIKLKQGFGRLIRAEDDRGVVIVLDRRIVDRKYGRKFLNSLPVKMHFKGETPAVVQKVADWLQGGHDLTCSFQLIEDKDIDKYLDRLRRKKSRHMP